MLMLFRKLSKSIPALINNCTAGALVLAVLLFVSGAHATNFNINEYAEVNQSEARTILPSLVDAYPNARFLVAGFSSETGDWKFIRVEDSSACQDAACPVVIVHSKSDWKIMVIARKEIRVSITGVNRTYVQANLIGRDGAEFVARYVDDNKIIYISTDSKK